MKYLTRIACLSCLILFLICTGCSDDDCPSCPNSGKINKIGAWAGTYDTDTKFGGAAGVWDAASDITITEDGEIFFREALILNPVIDESTISWTNADGNGHNVTITFATSQTDDYYWADIGGSAYGRLFHGSIQSGASGPLDFRGLDWRLCWEGEYSCATKFGGAGGVWQGSAHLEFKKDGSIIHGSELILNPVMDRGSVSWSTGDGNTHNVSIGFRSSHTSAYYWEDLGGSVDGKLFTGSLQSGASGPLDFRGLVLDAP